MKAPVESEWELTRKTLINILNWREAVRRGGEEVENVCVRIYKFYEVAIDE